MGKQQSLIGLGLSAKQIVAFLQVVQASYPESNPFCRGQAQPAPLVSEISFEDVKVRGPTQGTAKK